MCSFLLVILSLFFLELKVHTISYCYIFLVDLPFCVYYIPSYFTETIYILNSIMWDISISKFSFY